MKMELPEIRPEERTPLVDALLGIIQQLLDRVGQIEEINQQLRDEIAKLKGQKPRPDIKPSILEASKPKSQEGGKRPGSAKRPKTAELHIHREVPLHADGLPVGSIFKGYEAYVVQELLIKNENTRYQRARYALPGGGSVLAPFPEGVLSVAGGHFGANLITYVLDQYHQAQVTEPLLLAQLWEYGIDISTGQLQRILTENKDVFHQEKGEVLAAGLTESSYIGTDDTGARHQGKNGYCTALGNDLFSYFESTDSKSRLNFLHVLQGSQHDYAINEMALAYWERQKLAAPLVDKLTQSPQEFAGLGGAQRRGSAVCRLCACRLLGARRPTAGANGAPQRRAPDNRRESASANLGLLQGPEGVSPAAGRGPQAQSGSPLRHLVCSENRVSQHRWSAEGHARPQGRLVTGTRTA
jgi:hypothetical protein